MIILRTPAELAATVRQVAATLPSHRHAEASDLRQAAGMLDALSAPAASSAPRRSSYQDIVDKVRQHTAGNREKP